MLKFLQIILVPFKNVLMDAGLLILYYQNRNVNLLYMEYDLQTWPALLKSPLSQSSPSGHYHPVCPQPSTMHT